jgi:hypothetical protein
MRRRLSLAVVVGVAALSAMPASATAATGPGTHRSFNCALRSRANGRWVSAELGDPARLQAMLRARANTVALDESFRCAAIGASSWAIRSRANDRVVSAEVGYPGAVYGELRASATTVGLREQYAFVSVRSCSCYAIRASNGRYVSAAPDDYGLFSFLLGGMLRARARVIGPWEEFDIVHGPRPTVTAVDNVIPGNGNIVGTDGSDRVVIFGTGFSTAQAATAFDFGAANPATDVTCASTTQCIATVPAYQPGMPDPVDVIAIVDGLASSLNPPHDQVIYFGGLGNCCGF